MKTLEEWIDENKFNIEELQQRKWELDFKVMDAEAARGNFQGQLLSLEVARDRSEDMDPNLEKRIRTIFLMEKEESGKLLMLRAQRKRVAFALKTARRVVHKSDFHQTHDPND